MKFHFWRQIMTESSDVSDARRQRQDLTNQADITLHTIDAKILFYGKRDDPNSVGLFQFGKQMTRIAIAASLDDPFADNMLLKVEEHLHQIQQGLSTLLNKHLELFNQSNSSPGLRVEVFKSEEPLQRTLYFNSQPGFLAAEILAKFDHLMQVLITSKRIGDPRGKEHAKEREIWIKTIKDLFKLPFEWERYDVTREDLKLGNNIAELAIEKMGELPESIINLSKRAQFAPNIRTKLDRDRDSLKGS